MQIPEELYTNIHDLLWLDARPSNIELILNQES